MPITLSHEEPATLRFTFEGEYSFDEVLEVVAEGVARVDPAHRVLGVLDIRDSSEVRTSAELRTLAWRLSSAQTFSAIAVLAKEAVHYGLARMFSAFAEEAGLVVMAFQTEEATVPSLDAALAAQSERPPRS